MKICIITPEFPPQIGGVGVHVRNLVNRLILREHKVTVLRPNSTQGRISSKLMPKAGIVGLIPFYNNSLKRIVSGKYEYDVVHIHGVGYSIPAAIRNETIVTVHTSYVGKARAYEKLIRTSLLSRQIQELIKICPEFVYYNWATNLEKATVETANKIIAVNDSIANELTFHKSELTVKVIYNAIDDSFAKAVSSIQKKSYGDKKVILSVGRLIPRKGFSILLKAASKIVKTSKDVEFHIVGRGSDFLALVRLSRKLGIHKYVKFLGAISFERLLREYKSCDIFVQASVYEGLPTTMLEAMAAGKAVVAIEAPYVYSVIQDCKNGLISRASYNELAEKIDLLLSNKDMRSEFGEKNAVMVRKRFSWDSVVRKIEKEYFKVGSSQNYS